MNSVADVSDKLGEYMLKGWILTDKSCPTQGCRIPLMRSPNTRSPALSFCANCDESPDVVRASDPYMAIPDSSSTISSNSHISRSSTPPTEVSSALSSPTFAPPVETAESRRRRDQSDRASTEIGKRLLKGWAMLGEECPNVSCFGVPLVRPPKVGGGKDSRKECVICETVYITDMDKSGQEHLIPVNSGTQQRALATSLAPMKSEPENRVLHDSTINSPRSKSLASSQATGSKADQNFASQPIIDDLSMHSEPDSIVLKESVSSLQLALHALSTRLTSLSSSKFALDPSSISQTADAISKVTQALCQIRQLQWSTQGQKSP